VYYGGGGGGGRYNNLGTTTGISGGSGGGGKGNADLSCSTTTIASSEIDLANPGQDGVQNSGGGGGGGGVRVGCSSSPYYSLSYGGAGGSGVLILAVQGNRTETIVDFSLGVTYFKDTTSRSGYTVYKFSSGFGRITFNS
jgi:hypothetical protein